MKNHSLIVIKIKDNLIKSYFLKEAVYKTTDQKGVEFNCHKYDVSMLISLQHDVV